VLGVAVLAAVFARHGVYGSPRLFVQGFIPALWVGVGLTIIGALAAALYPGRDPKTEPAVSEPALAFAAEVG
jgi:hypothetical protein